MQGKYLAQDLSQRIGGGVAFYDGKPVFVHVSGEILALYDFPARKDIQKTTTQDDPLLDISSPDLGWVNNKGSCYYISRKPERKYKQTLNVSVVSYFDPCVSARNQFDYDPSFLERLFYSKAFETMLLNKYPTLESTFNDINSGKVKSQAITREVALMKDTFDRIHVYFKTKEVGFINPNDNVVHVPGGENAWVVSKYLSELNWSID